eukprot:4271106-Amphidinium_carterae.1
MESKLKFTREDESKAVKLSLADRVDRQKQRITGDTGISQTGFNAPSHKLVDLGASMYESNMVFWIDWERCTRRDQELTHTHKEMALVVDQKTGTIKSA